MWHQICRSLEQELGRRIKRFRFQWTFSSRNGRGAALCSCATRKCLLHCLKSSSPSDLLGIRTLCKFLYILAFHGTRSTYTLRALIAEALNPKSEFSCEAQSLENRHYRSWDPWASSQSPIAAAARSASYGAAYRRSSS